MKEFAERLRERIFALRLSNAEVARRMGLSDQRLGNYLAGTREPDLATLARLALALETTPNELIGFVPEDANSVTRAELAGRATRALERMNNRQLEVVVQMLEAVR